eukprot:CAMPEP_0206493904 /NCGR_PEP_ID=MMETSP0324_2-20121206/47340_1 /ASSEMBLY_ACC=CAM_ASM_000836 /TAXON_ID=2866 /ORGANISM="Crypthecodinium cohnii, Strain Seligo" /LENGTH=33 /DNA_ID= /DNA_START= /DNA_END= /DNA_ORIENTATION=
MAESAPACSLQARVNKQQKGNLSTSNGTMLPSA